ncbi:hypothetical protein PybrP1_010657 [[Pythium] brassicae (nom. inval.)]|nr:hypothetical protein PybrP1_010657 [[Pythium] brassicae (nom. inval.)]
MGKSATKHEIAVNAAAAASVGSNGDDSGRSSRGGSGGAARSDNTDTLLRSSAATAEASREVFQGLFQDLGRQAMAMEAILRCVCGKVDSMEGWMTEMSFGMTELDLKLRNIAHNIEGTSANVDDEAANVHRWVVPPEPDSKTSRVAATVKKKLGPNRTTVKMTGMVASIIDTLGAPVEERERVGKKKSLIAAVAAKKVHKKKAGHHHSQSQGEDDTKTPDGSAGRPVVADDSEATTLASLLKKKSSRKAERELRQKSSSRKQSQLTTEKSGKATGESAAAPAQEEMSRTEPEPSTSNAGATHGSEDSGSGSSSSSRSSSSSSSASDSGSDSASEDGADAAGALKDPSRRSGPNASSMTRTITALKKLKKAHVLTAEEEDELKQRAQDKWFKLKGHVKEKKKKDVANILLKRKKNVFTVSARIELLEDKSKARAGGATERRSAPCHEVFASIKQLSADLKTKVDGATGDALRRQVYDINAGLQALDKRLAGGSAPVLDKLRQLAKEVEVVHTSFAEQLVLAGEAIATTKREAAKAADEHRGQLELVSLALQQQVAALQDAHDAKLRELPDHTAALEGIKRVLRRKADLKQLKEYAIVVSANPDADSGAADVADDDRASHLKKVNPGTSSGKIYRSNVPFSAQLVGVHGATTTAPIHSILVNATRAAMSPDRPISAPAAALKKKAPYSKSRSQVGAPPPK